MLKIILFAYSKGVYSSRRIEQLCIENIVFKALSGNTCPDHSTISEFVSSMGEDIQNIFVDVLTVCNEMDLIGGEIFALDGHKVSSNASKEWSGKISDLDNKQNKFKKVTELLVKKHKETDSKEEKENYKERIIKYKAKINKITEFIKENKPKEGKRIKEKQSNITDNESARIKSSHGVIQGYTGEAMTDEKNQIIIYAEAFGDSHEQEYVDDMVIGTEKIMKAIRGQNNYLSGKKLLADNGNFSEKNLEYLAKKKIDAYIPDNEFRKRDPRFKTAKRHAEKKKGEDKSYYRADKFQYNKSKDIFTCPAGNILKKRANEIKIKGRYLGKKFKAKDSDCKDCKLRNKCLKNKNAKSKVLLILRDIPHQKNYSELMKAKIDTEEGRDIYSKRMGIVEPVFANIRFHKRLNYFTLRTKKKVNIQWNLFALVHNIDKIRKFI